MLFLNAGYANERIKAMLVTRSAQEESKKMIASNQYHSYNTDFIELLTLDDYVYMNV